MNAVDYLKEKVRMTRGCNILCRNCPLGGEDCCDLERDNPEQAIEIVEKWAKEHPVKTYLSVLLEKFPNVKLNNKGVPDVFCPYHVFKTSKPCNDRYVACINCWNREYKEEE